MPSATASGFPYPVGSDEMADTDLYIKALADFLETYIGRTAWTAVTFQNSWVNSGGGPQDVQYRRVGDDVQARGHMKSGTTGATAFTFPTGFRPPALLTLPVLGSAAAAGYFLTINTNGTVVPSGPANTLFAFNFQFSVTA